MAVKSYITLEPVRGKLLHSMSVHNSQAQSSNRKLLRWQWIRWLCLITHWHKINFCCKVTAAFVKSKYFQAGPVFKLTQLITKYKTYLKIPFDKCSGLFLSSIDYKEEFCCWYHLNHLISLIFVLLLFPVLNWWQGCKTFSLIPHWWLEK